jgi:hypothetical protein
VVEPEAERPNPLQEMRLLKNKLLALNTRLRDVQRKLKLDRDEDIRALKGAVERAQKALQEGIEAKIRSDPEGAEILDRIEETNQQLMALREKSRGGERLRKVDPALLKRGQGDAPAEAPQVEQ